MSGVLMSFLVVGMFVYLYHKICEKNKQEIITNKFL